MAIRPLLSTSVCILGATLAIAGGPSAPVMNKALIAIALPNMGPITISGQMGHDVLDLGPATNLDGQCDAAAGEIGQIVGTDSGQPDALGHSGTVLLLFWGN